MPTSDIVSDNVIDELTTKQRAVMELLIQHQTSKEIGRSLGISPHTVDQRIQFAKKKLGVTSRAEAAVRYRELKMICDKTVYEESCLSDAAIPLDNESQDDTAAYLLKCSEPINSVLDVEVEADYRVVPEMFEGIYGKLARVIAMFLVSCSFIILGLAVLAMFSGLSAIYAE